MYVITVLFTVLPAHRAEFLAAIVENAGTSLENEPGCRQFDVCTAVNAVDEIFLYEIYDSEAAFAAHLASEHFGRFNEQTQAWVKTKTVRAFLKSQAQEAFSRGRLL
ncbi:MAG: putative quinol monooxygenase [Polaromonas sp.]|nr:putative quinol monooxygenase [Polaromonas sp.]